MRVNGGFLIRGWTDWLQAGGTRSSTVYVYRRYVERLHEAFDLVTVTTREVVGWLAGKAWVEETRKSCHSALKSFFGWTRTQGYRRDDPTADLRPIKLPPPCPRPATDRVWTGALSSSDADVRLMIMLAGLAGLRRSEIASLHTDNLEDDLLRITGKGGRTRLIPVDSPELLAALQSRPEGWVFPGRFPGQHVCADLVGKRLSAALGPGWTGHKLRHRFASRAYRGTHDLLAVQALLGHSSPTTTLRYVLIDEDHLRAAVHAAA